MKTSKRLLILFCCTVVLFSNLFMCYTMPVFAKPTLDENGHLHVYNWDDIKDSAVDWVMYMASMVGAIFADHDFAKYVQSKEAWVDYWKEDNVVIGEDGTSVTFSKEIMAFIKQCLDEYAKTEQTKEENGGFYLLPTTPMEEVPASWFINSKQFSTFRRIVMENGVLPVMVQYRGLPMRFIDPFSDPDHPILLVGNVSDLNQLTTLPHMPVSCTFFCASEWNTHNFRVKTFPESDQIYTSISDGIDYDSGSTTKNYSDNSKVNYDVENHGGISQQSWVLYSTTGEHVRVFVSNNAAKNYSVGSRKIYFTENYYNYVPEDLTVAVDDLQKSVDDLQKVIDELLKQINDNSSEKEIEELLRLILEELRNNPGGGGGGSGSGDVTVSVDLKETNYWLSKIYDRLGEILDRIKAKIETGLDEISETLKKIKNWTAVDTVIDGVDAVADWLDLIHDVLTDGAGSAVSALSSALQDSTDLMKQKFPFSMPWDILFFVTVLSAEPETPHFVIPIDIDMEWVDINIHYDFVLDFSQFQWLSDLSRLILSMTYAAGLMKKTLEIVSANKEG